MVFEQSNFREDLRDIFSNIVIKVFGDSTRFLDFIENKKYSSKYDCFIDYDGENYIINRESGEYINWYKFVHIGRSIVISTAFPNYKNISKWIDEFLIDFKKSEEQ